MGLAWYAEVFAGGLVGIGLLVWIVRTLNNSGAAQIEKASAENLAKGEIEKQAVEKAVNQAAREAQTKAQDSTSDDW